MPCHCGLAEKIHVGIVIFAEFVHQRADGQRWVSHPSGNDDIRAVRQCLRDLPSADVGVGGNDLIRQRVQRLTRLHNREIAVCRYPFRYLVADNSRDLQISQVVLRRHFPHLFGRGDGIGRPHVGDDLHWMIPQQRQHPLHAILQKSIVSLLRVRRTIFLRQRDGPFRQAFKHDVIDVASADVFQCRLNAVTGITGTRRDPDRFHLLHLICPKFLKMHFR